MDTLRLNMLTEQVYITGQVNRIYEGMLKEETTNPEDKKILDDIKTDMKLSSKFIFQFGTGIGAFMGPVTELLKNGGFNLNKEQVALLIITSLAIMISDDTVEIGKLQHEVEEEGLEIHLGTVTKFLLSVKNLMSVIGKKVGKSVHTLSDILGFTFMLVPTMNILKELINTYNVTGDSLSQFLVGLVGASASYGMKSIIDRIMKRHG